MKISLGGKNRKRKISNNNDIHKLYSSLHTIWILKSLNIIRMIRSRRMRWAGHAARMGEKGNAYRILVGKPEGKSPLGGPMRSWVNNIKM
jgi:hypothetical protein